MARRGRRSGPRARNGKWTDVKFEDQALQNTLDQLLELKKMKVKVGYVPPYSRAKYPDGTTVAKVAAIHEFGSGHTPARSYLRDTIWRHRSSIADLERAQLAKAIAGTITNAQAMEAVGKFILGLYRAKLAAAGSWAKPLDPKTLKQKGDPRVLYDTALLSKSLSYRVAMGRKLIVAGNEV